MNQYALFSLTSQPDAALDRWLESRPELGRRLILPAGPKWEVRDKLGQAGINERVLFPGRPPAVRLRRETARVSVAFVPKVQHRCRGSSSPLSGFGQFIT